jgi:hypothetical protein
VFTGNLRLGKEVLYVANKSFKIGRHAGTGKFMPVKEAKEKKSTAVVETIKRKK